jgi:dienelactone hydrolase
MLLRPLIVPILRWCLALIIGIAASQSLAAEVGPPRTLSTADGVAFAVLGEKPARPAPTLFIFALDAERTLNSTLYRRAGNELAKRGYLCVSLDLPCHGAQRRNGEAAELNGWAQRVAAGDDIMEEFTGRAKKVLDYLIAEKYTDQSRIAACGTSRGGFSAIHFAAADARVQCAVGYSPVTDLAALREFNGIKDRTLINSLKLANNVERLTGRDIYLAIGDRDERVSTDKAIEFARTLSAATAAKKSTGQIELHVCTAKGHETPAEPAQQSAAWIEKMLKAD